MKRRTKSFRRRSTESPRRVLIKQIAIGLGLLLFISALLYGTWYVTRLPLFTINEVTVVGGTTIAHDELVATTNEVLEGEYFRLIPKRFVWLYPQEAIQAAVAANNRIKNVLVERNGKTIAIAFEEYRPVALWCGGLESKECLFLDRNGLAFAAAPRLEGAAFVRYSDVEAEPSVGATIFAGEYVEATNAFVENAYDQLGLNIIHVERSAKEEILYHVSGGGVIKVSTRESVVDTLDNLDTILSSEEFSHLGPGTFKYIDLRFGNKIFVNEGQEETATSTEAAADLNVF